MGAEMPSDLGSGNVGIDGQTEGPAGTTCSNELGDGKEKPGQSNNLAFDHSDGNGLIDGDTYPVSNGFIELEKEQMLLSENDLMLEAFVSEAVEATSSMASISEGNEHIGAALEEFANERTDGVVLGEMGSSRDISGWTNNVLNPEGGLTGWVTPDGVAVSVVPSGPDRVSTPRRRVLYMIKIPRFVDSKLKNQMRLAELQVEEMNKKREFYRAALQLKRSSKGELLEKLKPARDRERACRDVIQSKRMEMEPYQLALNKFKNAFGTAREKGQELCSSEEQLNERIAYLRHRIEHESIPLKEEKQLLRDIKQLEATRSQVCANMVLQAELVESVGPKEEIQGRCKLLGSELDGLRKEHRQARVEFEAVEKEVETLNVSIEELWQHVEKCNLAQREMYEAFKELRKKDNERNAEFYNYRREIQSAKKLAFKKNLGDLENLCFGQVERILALWNANAEFRNAYIKNNERSTLRRLETLDGRSLGPDEEPPLMINDLDTSVDLNRNSERTSFAVPRAVATGGGSTKGSKVIKEESKLLAKTMKPMSKENLMESNVTLESRIPEEKHIGYVDPGKGSGGKINLDSQIKDVENGAKEEAEVTDLKEKRRQVEITKAKEAAERKKRQVEKAQAKALIRAQRNSERREKEKEKRARKKASVNATAGLGTDPVDMVSQSERKGVIAATEEIAPDNDNMNQEMDTQESSKMSHLPRKKAVGKMAKKPRPALKTPLPKKVIGRLSTWYWVILVLIVAFFAALVVYMQTKF